MPASAGFFTIGFSGLRFFPVDRLKLNDVTDGQELRRVPSAAGIFRCREIAN